MHSLLAGRMLLQLREWGKVTIRGQDFGSSFSDHVNTLEFQQIDDMDDADESEVMPMILETGPSGEMP